jgi:hypothetical protein
VNRLIVFRHDVPREPSAQSPFANTIPGFTSVGILASSQRQCERSEPRREEASRGAGGGTRASEQGC